MHPWQLNCEWMLSMQTHSYKFNRHNLSQACLLLNAICLTFNPLNAELNPTYHLLALLGAHPILHISRIRVKNHPIYRTGVLLPSRCCVLYIFFPATISTEYFKHAAHSLFFSSKCRLFRNATFFGSSVIHILHTGCAKI